MRLRIHEDGVPHEDGVIYLGLVSPNEREVILAAVDANGDILLDADSERHGGGILTIHDGGYLALSPAVMPCLGFHLDIDGRICLDPKTEAETARRAQRFGGKRAAFKSVEEESP